MKINSIYQQLLINIVIPVILGLLILGIFSYKNTKTILDQHDNTEKDFIYDEIRSFVELQFVALDIIEEPVEKELEKFSNILVTKIFKNTSNIENANLIEVRKELGMNEKDFDLYIINKDGIVVNTTFREDLFINFFNFGNVHERYLNKVFRDEKFDSPTFFFEHKTKRYKKYSYQPTLDNRYIIEIGVYSYQADQVYDYMIDHLVEIPVKKPNLTDVDLFFWLDKPTPLNLKKEFFPEHLSALPSLAQGQTVTLPHSNTNGKEINYSYFFIENVNPKLIRGTIVRIANDPAAQKAFIKKELTKIIGILLFSIIVVYVVIFVRAHKIVSPIKMLIETTKRIANGNYSERVNTLGNNEISELSKQFNKMVNNIEERNNQIEEQSEFLYQANRKINDAYKLLDHQKSLLENKQDDITASLNYALRIQESLIPTPEEFDEIFPESFVHIMPRDIVSGDFYWFSKIKDKTIVVAADCTGHGVPGAFMSMIGMTILHNLVNYEHILDPASIVKRLDAEICDLLVYRNASQLRFEGMDAIVLCINNNNNTVTYASAQRPLVLIRDGEVQTYKGSIYPIGEYYDDIQKIFKNTEIELKENDLIYLFSDGYTSQFNEENTKKFNLTKFKTLLKDIHKKPIKEQAIILQRTYEAWKGSNEQIDDILVLGFKYTPGMEKKKISAKTIIEEL